MLNPRAIRLPTLLLAGASLALTLAAHAQSTSQPVAWELQVLSDGQQIDSFSATTNVGQARTDTHHNVVKNNVGCADKPAGDIDLQRTLTVSPTHAGPDDITLSIEAQETLQDDASRATVQGCKLPPQPRVVNASHPGLVLKPGEWSNWQIVEKNPSLAYRVRASLNTTAAAQ
ncbi:hypothetical protein [Caballeronia telluris]|uniref:Lipoprotein n=1 Tax=Caballeronia telluris TaxID=326475 RepID=A0A158J3B1_9BURK|nr:hypothetical protein [Caballeronia telluris]SAL63338.1 hypothetical protein AWB66_03762 [Caballeronia telluris]